MVRSTSASSGVTAASARSAPIVRQNAPEPFCVLVPDRLELLGIVELPVALLLAEGGRDRGPDVAALPVALPQQPQGVGGDTAGRARQGAEQELVVEGVGDHAEQAQQVLDLLLRPVTAAADHVRLQPEALQRVLVRVDVRECPQQDDDVPGSASPESTSSRRRSARARACATVAQLPSDGGGSSSIPSAFHLR